MDLLEIWAQKTREIEQTLENVLPPEETKPGILHQSMRYSTLNGGKRLRGFLVCAAAELFGGNRQAALELAAAMEMIHAYSLIHDDLPCMDNDDLRRGRPTNHKVFGEAIALLAGDALITHAFLVLSNLTRLSVPGEKVLNIIKEIAEACGTGGMIGGQTEDICAEGKEIAIEDLRLIHRLKTGALIRAAVRTGALLGRVTEVELAAVTVYGEKIGLAFQITDDILNETGTPDILGKPIKSDQERRKATYPSFFGLERSKELAVMEINGAHEAIKILGEKARILHELADYIFERNK